MKEVICICCPKGCRLHVDDQHDYAVTGNSCSRGAEYGKNELLHPVRTVTATVALKSSALPRLPVKTDGPVPKGLMMDVIGEFQKTAVSCPVHMGDVIISHVCGTDANVVATRTVLS